MSVNLSVTEVDIIGKQRKRQEKKLLVKDHIYCENSTVGDSRQIQEKHKLAFARERSGVRAQSSRRKDFIN